MHWRCSHCESTYQRPDQPRQCPLCGARRMQLVLPGGAPERFGRDIECLEAWENFRTFWPLYSQRLAPAEEQPELAA